MSRGPTLSSDESASLWTEADVARFMEHEVAFNQHLGIHIAFFTPGEVHLALPFAPHLIGDPSRPALQGGVLSTLADTTGGAAAMSVLAANQMLSTVDLLVDYLRPAPAKDLIAKGRVVRRGNRVCLTEIEVFSRGDDEHMLAKGRAVYNIVNTLAKAPTGTSSG